VGPSGIKLTVWNTFKVFGSVTAVRGNQTMLQNKNAYAHLSYEHLTNSQYMPVI